MKRNDAASIKDFEPLVGEKYFIFMKGSMFCLGKNYNSELYYIELNDLLIFNKRTFIRDNHPYSGAILTNSIDEDILATGDELHNSYKNFPFSSGYRIYVYKSSKASINEILHIFDSEKETIEFFDHFLYYIMDVLTNFKRLEKTKFTFLGEKFYYKANDYNLEVHIARNQNLWALIELGKQFGFEIFDVQILDKSKTYSILIPNYLLTEFEKEFIIQDDSKNI